MNLTFGSELLNDFGTASGREWLVTNGIGGYASSSLSGANTRRYHGLLTAALHPPVGRAVLLSKLEETLEITGKKGEPDVIYSLSANQYPGAIYPQGHLLLESWAAYPVPTWVWHPAPGVRLEKRIWMERLRNTTYISYRLLEAPKNVARLRLVPLLAWKDYHSEMHAYPGVLEATWSVPDPGVLPVTLPGVPNVQAKPLTLRLKLAQDDGAPHPNVSFAAHPDWYFRFQHPREQECGPDYEEDLYSPGAFSALLKVGESLIVIASTEEAPAEAPQTSWRRMAQRQEDLLCKAGTDNEFARALTLAADAFVVEVPEGRSTVIAGYHWFTDFSRDTLISLPGLCLATGRPEVAREILLSVISGLDRGLLPNRFPDVDGPPEYNTADATLWLYQALWAYLQGGEEFNTRLELVHQLWPTLDKIIQLHLQGLRYGIGVDPEDGLLIADAPGVALTWMDAKLGDWVVTPRRGKPVEINALWYNALCIMEQLAGAIGKEAKPYANLAATVKQSFRSAFVRQDGRGLYDVVSSERLNDRIRPNQIFAVSLPHSPLTVSEQQSVLNTIEAALLTPLGLRTLSPEDPDYHPRSGGSAFERDAAYHRGSVCPWLLGPFVTAHLKVHGDADRAHRFLLPLQENLREGGIGFLSELFDGDPPHRPGGCIARAWSIAEVLRAWKLTGG